MKPSIQSSKLLYLEILKVIAIGFLIPVHTAMIFTSPSLTYVRDISVNSKEMSLFVQGCWQWILPLLFFISGIGTYFSLKTRTAKQYIIERLKRLYVPLVFGTLCIISIQTYIMAITQYGFKGSFFDFFSKEFFNGTGMTPDGYFNWGHLWFISYLFHFSLLALPFFIYCLKDSKPYLIQKILQIIYNGSIILPLLLLILVECIFRAKWPGDLSLINDWANFLSFFILFIYGFFYAGGFIKSKSEKPLYPYFFIMAAISMIVYLWLPQFPIGYNTNFILSRMLAAFNTYACVVFFIDFAKNKLNYTNTIIQYASYISVPVYLLHYLAVTLVGYYIVQLPLAITGKTILILVFSFVMTIAACELVKRISLLRFLLGLK